MNERIGVAEAQRRTGYDKQHLRRLYREETLVGSKNPEGRIEIESSSLAKYCEKVGREYRQPQA